MTHQTWKFVKAMRPLFADPVTYKVDSRSCVKCLTFGKYALILVDLDATKEAIVYQYVQVTFQTKAT